MKKLCLQFGGSVALLWLLLGPAVVQATPYSSAVLSAGPVAYWRFEDATSAAGNPAADTTGNHPGVYTNAATLVSNVAADLGGTAAQFNAGASQHITATRLGTTGSQLGTGVTFEFWMKTADTATQRRIFGVFNTGNNTTVTMASNSDQSFVGTVGNTQVFVRREGGGDLAATFDSSLVNIYDDQWHHIVWRLDQIATKGVASPTIDTSAFQLTIDNQPIPLTYGATFAAAPSFANFNQPFRIASAGRDMPFANSYLNGRIDEFAIYNRVLSDAEIAQHFAAASVPEPSTLAMLVLGALGASVQVYRRRMRCAD